MNPGGGAVVKQRTETKLYYSISEAAALTQVKPHVLRYWETQFKLLRPRKNKAGTRMYRRRDLKLILMIKELLYDQGFTISGAKKKLLDDRDLIREQLELTFDDVDRGAMLLEVRRELESILKDLRGNPGA